MSTLAVAGVSSAKLMVKAFVKHYRPLGRIGYGVEAVLAGGYFLALNHYIVRKLDAGGGVGTRAPALAVGRQRRGGTKYFTVLERWTAVGDGYVGEAYALRYGAFGAGLRGHNLRLRHGSRKKGSRKGYGGGQMHGNFGHFSGERKGVERPKIAK
nr:hypothetical protein [Tanacetum cinerariifolium]